MVISTRTKFTDQLNDVEGYIRRFGEKAVRVEVLAVSEAVKKNDAPAMYRELA